MFCWVAGEGWTLSHFASSGKCTYVGHVHLPSAAMHYLLPQGEDQQLGDDEEGLTRGWKKIEAGWEEISVEW